MRWIHLLRGRLNNALSKKMVLTGAFLAVSLGAFLWGRFGSDHARANGPLGVAEHLADAAQGQASSDYGRRIVAQIYGNVPITREDLGEYLIARFGAERLEFLVNRRIVETACKAKNVYVTDAEIQAQLQQDLKTFNVNEKDFVTNILKRFNKSMFEWREDVLRPKLLLAKLVRPTIEVTQTDLLQAFEARYGQKVQCRIIILQGTLPKSQRETIWQEVNKDDAAFLKRAREQFIPQLQANGGQVPPFHKHFPDPQLERVAFSLQEGQVSELLGLKDGTYAILKCEKRLPPDHTVSFDKERVKLFDELKEIKLAQRMPEVFNELRRDAAPQYYLNGRTRQDELEQAVMRELQGGQQPNTTLPIVNVPMVTPKN